MASFPHRRWADLPIELVGLILDRLVLLPDYIRFAAVCKGWCSAARENHQDRRTTCYQQPPMILLPPTARDEDHRYLYSLWEQKFYFHPLIIPYTTPNIRNSAFTIQKKWCCGSSYGWLAIADEKDFSITMLNPFLGNRNTLKLPTISNYSLEYVVRMITFSCDPCLNPNDWAAVAIYGIKSRLAFIRAGHSSWYNTSLRTEAIVAGFYEGQLYFMDRGYQLYRIAMHEEAGWEDGHKDRYTEVKGVKRVTRLVNQDTLRYLSKSYFVELEGDLLLVRRRYGSTADCYGTKEWSTVGFDVYKLCLKEEQSSAVGSHELGEWIEMHDLGEFSLFLGENKPICIDAATFPDCKPNCIYYMPDNRLLYDQIPHVVDDMGVFNLTRCRICRYNMIPPFQKSMPSPLWVSPNLT